MTWLFCVGTFFVGFLAGVVVRDALDMLRDKGGIMWHPKFPRVPGGALEVVVAVLLVCTLGMSVLLQQSRVDAQRTARDLAVYTECVSRWQQQFAASYQARLGVSLKVQEATDGAFAAVNAGDPEKIRQAIADYVKLRDQQSADRARNPIPALPNTLCGVPPR